MTPLFYASTLINDTIPSVTDGNSTIQNNPENMAKKFHVPYLGKLPMDPNMMKACENGASVLEAFPNSPVVKPLMHIVDNIVSQTTSKDKMISEECNLPLG